MAHEAEFYSRLEIDMVVCEKPYARGGMGVSLPLTLFSHIRARPEDLHSCHMSIATRTLSPQSLWPPLCWGWAGAAQPQDCPASPCACPGAVLLQNTATFGLWLRRGVLPRVALQAGHALSKTGTRCPHCPSQGS